jgi:preprotein translocase subunit SecG
MMILASMSVLTTIGSIAMVSVALLLIGLILLQKNRGSGLSGAFGGVGGHTAFGTKTGDFLTWLTVGLAIVFLLLAILLNFGFEPTSIAGAAGVTSPAQTADTSATEAASPAAAGTPAPTRIPGAPPYD